MPETEQHQSTGAPQVVMEERKEPEFIQFQRDGQQVTGRLANIEDVFVRDESGTDKAATRYTVEEGALRSGFFVSDNGRMVSFLGTYAIDSKLRPRDIGHFISLRFVGLDQQAGRNGNAMKRFEVKVSNVPVEDDSVGF